MNAQQRPADLLPRGAAPFTGLMIVLAIAGIGLARITGMPVAASPVAFRAEARIAPVASRMLGFSDRADGAVVIHDIERGETAAVIAAGEKTGFIRGVMRGFARDRRARGIGAAPPFTLTLWRDGQLSLTDTATDRSVELTAFGASNRAAFAALLKGHAR